MLMEPESQAKVSDPSNDTENGRSKLIHRWGVTPSIASTLSTVATSSFEALVGVRGYHLGYSLFSLAHFVPTLTILMSRNIFWKRIDGLHYLHTFCYIFCYFISYCFHFVILDVLYIH
jgi:hypothetical protein